MTEISRNDFRSDLRDVENRIIERLKEHRDVLESRMDDISDRSNERHVDNVNRFDRIEAKTDRIEIQTTRTNGRLTIAEEKIGRVELKLNAVRKTAESGETELAENRSINRRDVAMFAAGAGVLWGVLKGLAWILEVVKAGALTP